MSAENYELIRAKLAEQREKVFQGLRKLDPPVKPGDILDAVEGMEADEVR